MPINAVLDKFRGFKVSEKIRFSELRRGLNSTRMGFLYSQKRAKTAEFSRGLQLSVRDDFEGLAERVGFEPTVRFPAHTLSKRAP